MFASMNDSRKRTSALRVKANESSTMGDKASFDRLCSSCPAIPIPCRCTTNGITKRRFHEWGSLQQQRFFPGVFSVLSTTNQISKLLYHSVMECCSPSRWRFEDTCSTIFVSCNESCTKDMLDRWWGKRTCAGGGRSVGRPVEVGNG